MELDDDLWSNAQVVMPEGKASVHLRVDAYILEGFRSQGRGHSTRINAVFRSYVKAQKRVIGSNFWNISHCKRSCP